MQTDHRMKRSYLLFVLFSVTALQAQTPISMGRPDVYTSEKGGFSIPVPVLKSVGGRGYEEESSITFQDDFEAFLRIDYSELSQAMIERLESGEIPEAAYLEWMGKQQFFRSVILPAKPGTTIAGEQALTLDGRPAYLLTLSIPEGSTVLVNGARVDARRGFLLFIRNERVYIMHAQESILARMVGNKERLTDEEAHKEIREALLGYQKTMTFHPLKILPADEKLCVGVKKGSFYYEPAMGLLILVDRNGAAQTQIRYLDRFYKKEKITWTSSCSYELEAVELHDPILEEKIGQKWKITITGFTDRYYLWTMVRESGEVKKGRFYFVKDRDAFIEEQKKNPMNSIDPTETKEQKPQE